MQAMLFIQSAGQKRTEQMDSLLILVEEEYMKLRVVKVIEEKMGLNMADTLTMLGAGLSWAGLGWASLALPGGSLK